MPHKLITCPPTSHQGPRCPDTHLTLTSHGLFAEFNLQYRRTLLLLLAPPSEAALPCGAVGMLPQAVHLHHPHPDPLPTCTGTFKGSFKILNAAVQVVGQAAAYELRQYQRFQTYGPWPHAYSPTGQPNPA